MSGAILRHAFVAEIRTLQLESHNMTFKTGSAGRACSPNGDNDHAQAQRTSSLGSRSPSARAGTQTSGLIFRYPSDSAALTAVDVSGAATHSTSNCTAKSALVPNLTWP